MTKFKLYVLICLSMVAIVFATNIEQVFIKIWDNITYTKINSHLVPHTNEGCNLSYKWNLWRRVYARFAYFDELYVDYIITDSFTNVFNERIYSISLDSFSYKLGSEYSDSFVLRLLVYNDSTPLSPGQRLILISKWNIPFTLVDTLEHSTLNMFINDIYNKYCGYINNEWYANPSNIEYSPIQLRYTYLDNDDYIEFYTYTSIFDTSMPLKYVHLYTDKYDSFYASIIKFQKIYSSTNPYGNNHTFSFPIPTQDELTLYHIIEIDSITLGLDSAYIDLFYKIHCKGKYSINFHGLSGTQLILKNSSIQLHLLSEDIITIDTISYLRYGDTTFQHVICDSIIDTIY